MSDRETVDEIGAEAVEPGFTALVVAAFVEPSKVGAAALRQGFRSRAWLALGLTLVLALIGTAVCLPVNVEYNIEQMQRQGSAGGDPEAQAKMVEMFRGPVGYVVFGGSWLVMIVIGMALVTGGLHLGQLLLSGAARFGQVLAVTVYASVVGFGVGTLLKGILIRLKGSLEVSLGLGAVLSSRSFYDPLRSVLDMVDFFSLWAAWSAGVALAVSARLSKGAGLGVSLVVYVVLMGIGTAMRIIGGRFAS